MLSVVLTCCFICCVHVALGLVHRDLEGEVSCYDADLFVSGCDLAVAVVAAAYVILHCMNSCNMQSNCFC
jgi:hypothetical protein